MTNLALLIFDFDGTLTKELTYNKPDLRPESNTKQGLKPYIKHDKKHILAIATYHDNPKYVLSYLLPLLNLTEADILKKTESQYKHHQLTNVYIRGNHNPIVISTVLGTDYDKHTKKLAMSGKNTQIKDILSTTPLCSEHHFFDDTFSHINNAINEFKQFFCHHIERDIETFTINQTQEPSPGALLETLLRFYSSDRKNDVRGEYFNWLTYYGIKGYTRTDKINAVDDLLDTLTFGCKFNRAHLRPLRQGRLGNAISLWEQKTGLKLEDYISQHEAKNELTDIEEEILASGYESN